MTTWQGTTSESLLLRRVGVPAEQARAPRGAGAPAPQFSHTSVVVIDITIVIQLSNL